MRPGHRRRRRLHEPFGATRAGIQRTTTSSHAGLAKARPYDLRHSFASLLLHEGRYVIYVARQLGHGADLTLRTYGHVIEELEDSP
jgi:site-specific recombinase XerD